jgi:hypothetical protein
MTLVKKRAEFMFLEYLFDTDMKNCGIFSQQMVGPVQSFTLPIFTLISVLRYQTPSNYVLPLGFEAGPEYFTRVN